MNFSRLGKQAVFASLFALLAICCSSSPTRVDPGERSDIPSEGPTPGPLEEQVRQYVLDMTERLQADNPDPHDKALSIGRYLTAHDAEIRSTVQQLRERIDQMSPAERVYYEEQFSLYFESATRMWHQVLQEFREAHPDDATLVDGLMIRFD
ncbi:MAG: hypothetical protein JW797_13885 [Bradymonadales bacterium]|nr:hypothetical protein [Bradymonadales bacterium]